LNNIVLFFPSNDPIPEPPQVFSLVVVRH